MKYRPRVIIVCSVTYGAVLALTVAVVRQRFNSLHTQAFVQGAGLLVVIFGALADVRPLARCVIAIALGAFVAALFWALIAPVNIFDDASTEFRHLLHVATQYLLALGMLVPVRLFFGSIGAPRAESTAPRPTVRLCLGLVFCSALVLRLALSAMPVHHVRNWLLGLAVIMACASAGPTLVLISRARAVGVALILVGVAGAIPGVSFVVRINHDPRFIQAAAEFLLTPTAAVLLLYFCGYRLRR
jgi:hypothetical protein